MMASGRALVDILPETAERSPSAWRRLGRGVASWAAIETLLIVGALLAHLALLPHDIYADGLRRYTELENLLTNGALTQDKYSIIGPLFATPLWLIGHIVRGPMEWSRASTW